MYNKTFYMSYVASHSWAMSVIAFSHLEVLYQCVIICSFHIHYIVDSNGVMLIVE